MPVYIKGLAAVSPQKTFASESFLKEILESNGDRLSVLEPSYEGVIDPRAIRRMSKIIRISVAAARKALSMAGVEIPNSIITGTSYGCLADTENFLQKMIVNKEEALNPTPFIQSTHNTISGQIALLLQCYGYNSTYTQRGFSFENCLTDASLQLDEQPELNLLVGGVDEIIDVSHRILQKFSLYRAEPVSNLKLLENPAPGAINGEGCAFFVLSGIPDHSVAQIKSVKTFYRPSGEAEIGEMISAFLKENDLDMSDVDILLSGKSGDSRYDGFYRMAEELLSESSFACYKHICGEYPTAQAFAVWIGAQLIAHNEIPEILLKNSVNRPALNTALVYNHYFGVHHSLILLQR